jgi:hypothetical protein
MHRYVVTFSDASQMGVFAECSDVAENYAEALMQAKGKRERSLFVFPVSAHDEERLYMVQMINEDAEAIWLMVDGHSLLCAAENAFTELTQDTEDVSWVVTEVIDLEAESARQHEGR